MRRDHWHFRVSGEGHRALEAWARQYGQIARWGVENAAGWVESFVAGHRPEEEVGAALARAACLATASEREGYGLVVVEAAARGTPSVVVDGPENAATELVADGINGAIAPSPEPHDLAAAILRVVEAGPALRASTAQWFEQNASRLQLDSSLKLVVRAYGEMPTAPAGTASSASDTLA